MKHNAITKIGIALALALGGVQAALAVCSAPGLNTATPYTAGPLDPATGFPEFIRDSNGLALERCLDPAFCFIDPVVPDNLLSVQIGSGGESFYWQSAASVPTATGSADIGMDGEAAFLPGPDPVAGQQFPFIRLRMRIDVTVPGTYTVIYPFGRETFNLAVGGAGAINVTFDVPMVADSVNQGCSGPWLQWDPAESAPPAGFIGDGGTPHTVIGGTVNNLFRVNGPVGSNLSGTGQDFVSTNLFVVSGKLFDGVLATPLAVDRTTYERSGNVGQVDVFANGSATATVNFSGDLNLPTGPIAMDVGTGTVAGLFSGTGLLTPDAGTLPGFVAVDATDALTDPTHLLSAVVDRVNITKAQYDVSTGVLTVEAESSDLDAVPAPTLTVVEYTALGLTTPAAHSTVSPPAVVHVSSSLGGSDSAQVTVIDNPPPVANDDAATVDEDTVDNIIDVLANDVELVDGIDVTTVAIVTAPANGTATPQPDGTVLYTPNPDFFGEDSFTYNVQDLSGTGNVSNAATVVVTVNPIPDTPVANDDTDTTDTATAKAINVLANDTDADNLTPPLNAGLTVNSVTQPTNGSVAITNGGLDVTYTPGIAGPDTFTYTVTDGVNVSASATVTVNVTQANNPPTAVDDAATVDEDSGSTLIDVLANDTDLDTDPLTVISVTQPPVGEGLAVNNGSSVTYSTSANFNGVTSFQYTISDGNGGTSTATVTVTVNPINDAPTAVADGLFNTTTSTPIFINVLANDTDPEGDALTINSVSQPSCPGSTATIGLGGTIAYTCPDPAFSGVDIFSYTVSDGSLVSTAANVTVVVSNASVGGTDYDIDRLVITRANVGQSTTPTLRATNNGTTNVSFRVPATVVGVRNGQVVYQETLLISSAPTRTRNWVFPSFAIDQVGDITFTVTILDDNADVDVATRLLRVR